jgi:tetratricopeptide (TPR) repeat protein
MDEIARQNPGTSRIKRWFDRLNGAYVNRAWIYAEHGEYQQAFENCNRALQLHIKDEIAYAYRARVYCWQGEYEQAPADCEQALTIDVECADAYGVRGLIAYKQEQYERARRF